MNNDGTRNYEPDRKAVCILTEACLDHFRDAPLPPFQLVGVVKVEPPDKAAEVVEELATRAGSGMCVFNGAFAWLFAGDQHADRARFTAWVRDAFAFSPSVRMSRAGWPVMVVTTGHWPVDPRLLPALPIALPVLAEAGLVSRPPRDVFTESGLPPPRALRLVQSDHGRVLSPRRSTTTSRSRRRFRPAAR